MLETVKKLGWAPDIVHCNDWMTALIPLYLKTTYKRDPIFLNRKSVFALYDNSFNQQFSSENLLEKVKMIDIDDEMLAHLKSNDYAGFIRMGLNYADVVVRLQEEYNLELMRLIDDIDAKQRVASIDQESEECFDSYYKLYNELVN